MGLSANAEKAVQELVANQLRTLMNAKEPIVEAEIVHTGDKLILPHGVSLQQAKGLIERRMAYEDEVVQLNETFDVFPWDGAHALNEVLTAMYGWAPATATPGFWGDNPPQLHNIDVGPNGEKKAVPWGTFQLPNVKGNVSCDASRKEGRLVFKIEAEVKRESQPVVERLFAEVRKFLKTGSIYQGKAIRVRFRDENGKPLVMPEPKFMRTDDIDENQLVYSRVVQSTIETNLFTPIKRVRELRANGLAVKRGVLLAGPYGTGKTLAAKVASKFAVQAGVTFLYVTRADELADAIKFARQYEEPACVIFCEDIDRVLDGERSTEMDDILNIIDGIDSKRSNIITVLTTNHLEGIHPAMLRPGRLDAIIDVKAPDAEAVQRLLRVYGGQSVDEDTDLSTVGRLLDGEIPAVIAEVVSRAKLSQLSMNEPGEPVTSLSAAALEDAAHTMVMQRNILSQQAKQPREPSDLEFTMRSVVSEVLDSAMDGIANTVLEKLR